MRSTLAAMLAVVALAGVACARQPAVTESWHIGRTATPGTCAAERPSDREVQFALASIGPDFELGISATDFPQSDGVYQAMLSFDGGPPVTLPAHLHTGLFEISLGRGEVAAAVVRAKQMTISIEGHVHRLSLAGAAAALDGVARCAGKPTLAEAHDLPPMPIPGGDWTLYETLPAQPGRACVAEIKRAEDIITLMYAGPGKLALTWKNLKWNFQPHPYEAQISLDGGPALKVRALSVDTFLEIALTDGDVVQQLRHAETLDWISPPLLTSSNVKGFGAALDAVDHCLKS